MVIAVSWRIYFFILRRKILFLFGRWLWALLYTELSSNGSTGAMSQLFPKGACSLQLVYPLSVQGWLMQCERGSSECWQPGMGSQSSSAPHCKWPLLSHCPACSHQHVWWDISDTEPSSDGAGITGLLRAAHLRFSCGLVPSWVCFLALCFVKANSWEGSESWHWRAGSRHFKIQAKVATSYLTIFISLFAYVFPPAPMHRR